MNRPTPVGDVVPTVIEDLIERSVAVRRRQPNWTDETERDYRQWVADLHWRQAEEARHDGA